MDRQSLRNRMHLSSAGLSYSLGYVRIVVLYVCWYIRDSEVVNSRTSPLRELVVRLV